MDTLSFSTARLLVRKNLEELDPNGSIMYNDESGSADTYNDNGSLDDIIRRNLPEAINAIHKIAPVQLVEGEKHVFPSDDNGCVQITEDGVIVIKLQSSDSFLRLVEFQAKDSNIVVTDILPEASPEGRKQLNPYIRGKADRPRLVLTQNSFSAPVLKYYSLTVIAPYVILPYDGDVRWGTSQRWPLCLNRFSYVKKQLYNESSPASSYNISRALRENIIDYLTALVLETYSDQRAQAFYKKAAAF